MTVEEYLEKLGESIIGLGQALSVAFSPFIGAIHTTAMQVAAEAERVGIVLNTILEDFDWDGIEIAVTLTHPERYYEESLTDWYDRLERAGLIDKYEYRLMYGKECWRAVLHSPVWVVGLAWEWVRGLWTKNGN